MQKILLFIITSITLSCKSVGIRFYNDSSEDFKKLIVDIRGKQYIFNKLKSKKATQTIHVAESYRYCYAEVFTNRDTLIFQPIDFVGEQLHTKGNLDMHLTILTDSNGQNRMLMFEQ